MCENEVWSRSRYVNIIHIYIGTDPFDGDESILHGNLHTLNFHGSCWVFSFLFGFFFFIYFHRRKYTNEWTSIVWEWNESHTDQTTKKETKTEHKLYMRIQSQTTHLNTYTWNANVPHCDRTNATFFALYIHIYGVKWVVVAVVDVVPSENSSFLVDFFVFVISIHFAHIFTKYIPFANQLKR